jgi:rhodanese-related sulfurtransferase
MIILLILNTLPKVYGDEQIDKNTKKAELKTYGPYCGLYCMYAALKLAGMDVEFGQLLKPEYLGSHKGSSLAELQKAAEDHGIYAVPVKRLTKHELYNSPYPIVLHVKTNPSRKKYDHYLLFLGRESNRVLLYDPPKSPKLVPFYELASRWNGIGLVVSTIPIELVDIADSTRNRFFIYISLTIVSIAIIHLFKSRVYPITTISKMQLIGLSIAQILVLGIVAMSCGMLYHFTNDEGLLAQNNGTAFVQKAYISSFIPKIDIQTVEQLLNSDSIFVDARYAKDFNKSHLPGAINIPVDTNDNEIQKALSRISKESHLTVYCQSKGCSFASKMAQKLIANGFKNVSIFKGGWDKWELKNDD